MIRNIKRFLKYEKLKNMNSYAEENLEKNSYIIPHKINQIEQQLQETFDKSSDFMIRQLSAGKGKQTKIIIAYIDSLVDKQMINSDIIMPIIANTNKIEKPLLTCFCNGLINSCNICEVDSFNECISSILSGNAVIFVEDFDRALKIGVQNCVKRNIEEPTSDVVIRGPREGFTENLQTNTTLLRKKIKNSKLKFEIMKVGEETNTEICICYIKGIAHDEIVKTVKDRISRIKIDAILESGYIEDFIQDSTFSIFPTIGNSEKPDIIAGKILEGRVAILCDGTPFVLTVPYLFIESLQSSEDYYVRSIYSFLIRMVRIIALFVTTLSPGIYVALVCFHQSVIPFKLALTVAASRDGIPLSPFVEALTMVITFELLREAGIRMPRAIGQAISIVGALVIGDAAVKAGLVSTPMVVVIAITAITSFIIPQMAGALLIIRLFIMAAANIIGFLGILTAFSLVFIHMCSLKSFGVNYLSPLTPLSGTDLKDTIVRFPLWAMFTRPKAFTWEHSGKAKFRK